MNEDFQVYLTKWEDHLLAKVLLSWQLIDEVTLKQAYQEAKAIMSNETSKLGRLLLRKRLLHEKDYVKVMVTVREYAQQLYLKSQENNQNIFSEYPQQDASECAETLCSESDNPESAQIHNPEPVYVESVQPQSRQSTDVSRLVSRSTDQTLYETESQEQYYKINDADEELEDFSYSEESKKRLREQQDCFEQYTLQSNSKKIFASYELLEEIGRGGMGLVYKARQMNLNRIVALKVLLAGDSATDKEIQHFRQEAEIAGSLQHPGIVSIYEVGEANHYQFFTMDYIEGETLQFHIKNKSRRKFLLKVMRDVAIALDYMHKHHIVHRDIKPSNIIITPDGESKIIDFGLAKRIDKNEIKQEKSTMGTPYYLSPEQVIGGKQKIDGRTDIYAMGVILYEILTGQVPFKSNSIVDLYRKIVDDEPILPTKLSRRIDKNIETICYQAMGKNPEHRYQTALELSEDLERYLEGKPILAKRTGVFQQKINRLRRHKTTIAMYGLFFLVLLVLGLFGYVHWQEEKMQRNENKARQILQSVEVDLQENRGTLPELLQKIEEANILAHYLDDILFVRAKVYHKFEEYQNALTDFTNFIIRNNKDSRAYFGRGIVYEDMRNIGDKNNILAIKDFTEAIQIDPEYIEAYTHRAICYNRSDNFQKGLDDIGEIGRIKIRILERAQKAYDLKEYEQALKDFKKLYDVDGQSFEASFGLAETYIQLKRWEEALIQLRNTDKLKPKDLNVHRYFHITFQNLIEQSLPEVSAKYQREYEYFKQKSKR
jgi:serine/threonine protein kinase